MNWWKAKKLIQRKPYLLDPYRCRSIESAKEFLAAEGRPSAEDVLTAARIRAGMSISEWEDFTGLSISDMERKCKRVTPIRFGNLFSLSRRVLIVIAILITLTVFIACTPVGRAWAVTAYNAIIEVIDGILYVRSEEQDAPFSPEPAVLDVDDTIVEYASLDEALAQINAPLLYISADSASLVRIQLTSNPLDGAYLESTYYLNGDVQITIKQDWGSRLEDSIVLDDSKQHIRLALENGMTIDGVYSGDDAVFIGASIIENTVIHISLVNIPNTTSLQETLSTLVMA